MNFSFIRNQRAIPYLISFFLITLFFTISSVYPYQIQTDVAAQVKSVQQWLRGETNLFYSLNIANPQDLSQNLRCWILWWPPGVAIAFLPLIAIGLPLGLAVKLTAYGLFILGCIGWLRVAEKLQASFVSKVIFSLVLPLYCLGHATTYSASNLNGGDILPFGIMPWVFLYTIHITCDSSNNSNTTYRYFLLNYSYLGVILGIIYWLKYAAFTGSLGILSYLLVCALFFQKQYSLPQRFGLVITATFFCILPFLLLGFINKTFAGIDSAITQINDAISAGTPNTRGIGLLFSLLGCQGLALFQTVDLLMHIFIFSDKTIPVFSSYSTAQKQLFIVTAGIPGTLVVSWLIFYSRKIVNQQIFILACCVSFIPLVLLAYLSYKLNYNFLAGDASRLTSSFFLFTEILVISAYLDWFFKINKNSSRVISYVIIILFLIAPNLFVVANFTKNSVLERIGKEYITTENRLYVPSLSNTNVKSVVNQIDELVKDDKDVVVLATEYGASYEAWLEIKHRTIPIFDWWAVTSKIRDAKTLTTSQDLRVVLVIPKYVEEDKERLLKTKQMFPQGRIWTPVENLSKSDTSVSLWFSDLKVR